MGKKIRSLREPKRGLFIYIYTTAPQNRLVRYCTNAVFKQLPGRSCVLHKGHRARPPQSTVQLASRSPVLSSGVESCRGVNKSSMGVHDS